MSLAFTDSMESAAHRSIECETPQISKTHSTMLKMENISKPELARKILVELLAILDNQRETNWRRGIKSAIAKITSDIDTASSAGFDNARSIYNTMTAGGRGFSEYSIWLDNEDERIKINNTLDNLRSKIWTIFNTLIFNLPHMQKK